MARLTEEERREILDKIRSKTFREEMKSLSAQRHNPVIVHGRVDMDRLITFLTEYNEFINHRPKPFRKMIDREMKL